MRNYISLTPLHYIIVLMDCFVCSLNALNILQRSRPVFYGDLYFYTLEGIFCIVPLCTFLLFVLCLISCKMYFVKDKALKQNAQKVHVINLTLCGICNLILSAYSYFMFLLFPVIHV